MSNGPRSTNTLEKIRFNKNSSKERFIIRSNSSTFEKSDVPRSESLKNMVDSSSSLHRNKVKSPNLSNTVLSINKNKNKQLQKKEKSEIYGPFKHLYQQKNYKVPKDLKNTTTQGQVNNGYLCLIDSINSESNIEAKFEACKLLCGEVQEKEKELGPVLQFLSHEYSNYIKSQQEKIQSQADVIKKLEDEKKMLLWEMHKIVNQNRSLAENVQKLEKIINKMVRKFKEIASVDAKTLEKTEDNWNLLARENSLFKEELNIAKHQVIFYREKAKKIQKVLQAIEKTGICMLKPKKEKPDQQKSKEITLKIEDEDDNTDNEDLVSGKQPSISKPLGIPILSLQILNSNPILNCSQHRNLLHT